MVATRFDTRPAQRGTASPRLVEMLFRSVGPDCRVLVVGGQTEDLPGTLVRRGCRVVAALPTCPGALAPETAGCERLICGDPSQIDWDREVGDDRFQAIVMVDGLEAFKDLAAFLRHAQRWLGPGGLFLISLPNAAYCGTRLALIDPGAGTSLRGANATRHYDRQEIESLLSQAGLVVGRIDRELVGLDRVRASAPASQLPADVVEALARLPEGLTSRFIVMAIPEASPGLIYQQLGRLESQWSGVAASLADIRQALDALTRRVESMASQATSFDALRPQVADLQSRVDSITDQGRTLHSLVAGRGEVGDVRRGLEAIHQTLTGSAPRARQAPALPPRNGRNPVRASLGDYRRMIDKIRGIVQAALPEDATVIVVSKGDDELTRLAPRRGWHFPQDAQGTYAGHHPADSREAIAQLERLRSRGGEFLLFPQTAFWWLDHYADFRRHLEQDHKLVLRLEETCLIYRLRNG